MPIPTSLQSDSVNTMPSIQAVSNHVNSMTTSKRISMVSSELYLRKVII